VTSDVTSIDTGPNQSQGSRWPNPPEASEIQALFDRIAPAYDGLNDWLSLGQHRVWKQMAAQWSGAQPGDSCLDLCCGSGDLARRLAQRVGRTGMVFGLDFSTAQLAIAAERTRNSVQPLNITWIEGNALNLPFESQQFDAATMGYGLRNLLDIPRSLSELYRVLKPRAKAAVLDFHQPSSVWVRAFQQWYLENLVVPVAASLDLKQEYAYIMPSLERFPTGPEQVNLACQAGFTQVVHYPIAAGTMGVLVVQKP